MPGKEIAYGDNNQGDNAEYQIIYCIRFLTLLRYRQNFTLIYKKVTITRDLPSPQATPFISEYPEPIILGSFEDLL